MHTTGLIERPVPISVPRIAPLLGAMSDADLPESYIVPAYRHLFTEDFKPIPGKFGTLRDGSRQMRDQKQIDSCTAMGQSVVKDGIEGKAISPRDGWAITKEIDAEWGYPKTAYGATAAAAAEAYVRGVASEMLVPSDPGGMNRDQYMDQSYVTPEILEDRKRNAGKSAYIVYRDEFRRTIFKTGQAIATYCQWYSGDNGIGRGGRDARMGMPEGDNVGGHQFGCIGWIKGDAVMMNSWGALWGWFGLFLVPTGTAVFGRLGAGYVHVDKDVAKLADLLAKFDGHNVQIHDRPEIYRCELGVLRKYPDEICFWAHGNLFNHDVMAISQEELDAIPKGAGMSIKDAPFRGQELVRQIRQSVGLK